MAFAPDIRRLCGALGAEVRGVDLAAELAPDVFARLEEAFLEHQVLVFRDQKLDPEQQLAFARRFGEPEVHPIVEGTQEHPELIRVHKPTGESASFGTGWHSDNTFFECPSLATILYGVMIPPYGGDTLFASTERAWQALSPALQERLEGLHGVHSARRAYDPAATGEAKYKGDAPLRYHWSDAIRDEVQHPLVRTHPRTGRKGLFVNPMFTLGVAELEEREGEALLGFLFEHIALPQWTCRVRWEPGTVTMWDNRAVWHTAMDDYQDFERLMVRVTLAGDRPF